MGLWIKMCCSSAPGTDLRPARYSKEKEVTICRAINTEAVGGAPSRKKNQNKKPNQTKKQQNRTKTPNKQKTQTNKQTHHGLLLQLKIHLWSVGRSQRKQVLYCWGVCLRCASGIFRAELSSLLQSPHTCWHREEPLKSNWFHSAIFCFLCSVLAGLFCTPWTIESF